MGFNLCLHQNKDQSSEVDVIGWNSLYKTKKKNKKQKQKIGVHPKKKKNGHKKKFIYYFYKIWVIIDIFITIKWCS